MNHDILHIGVNAAHVARLLSLADMMEQVGGILELAHDIKQLSGLLEWHVERATQGTEDARDYVDVRLSRDQIDTLHWLSGRTVATAIRIEKEADELHTAALAKEGVNFSSQPSAMNTPDHS